MMNDLLLFTMVAVLCCAFILVVNYFFGRP